MKNTPRGLTAIFLTLILLTSVVYATAEDVMSLNMPSSLKIIAEEAFCGNTAIEKVVISEGTTEIRSRAFADSSLAELVLPNTLTYIADDAFEGCDTFAVTVPENSYAYTRCIELKLIMPTPTPIPEIMLGTSSVDIPAGVTVKRLFRAPKDGEYLFYTTGDLDTYGYLYDENQTQLAYDDDDGSSHNFLISYDLTAGQQVYVGVRFYSSSRTGSVSLTAEHKPAPTPTPTPPPTPTPTPTPTLTPTPVPTPTPTPEVLPGGRYVGEVVLCSKTRIEYCNTCGILLRNYSVTITGHRGVLDGYNVYFVTRKCCGQKTSIIETEIIN